MVRRAASSATDDSLKENSGLRSFAANGKGKEVKRERALRNSKSVGRRVPSEDEEMQVDSGGREEEDEDDDAQEEEEEEEEEEQQGQGSPKGRKRARANTNGDSYPSGSNVKIEETRAAILPRDDDGYIPGSLVRVQLRNFVTYDYVEFCPGPYLNMILGPNGTGKSSIACAICLGLNFPPHVLGRANDLNQFVKNGQDNGHIEIELKGPKGETNLVIKRFLKASSKSSTFTLNGESASGKEVANRMSKLNVQVSNLCSFLPQDRVAEFARMSPQQLLKETQRAAGNRLLTNWHETLISTGKELKAIQGSLDEDRKQHDNLEERNATLERDVKRFKERQAIEQQIEFLEIVAPYREYREASEKYFELKKVRGALHNKVRALKEANAPVEAFKEDLSRQSEELVRKRDAKKTSTKRKFTQLKAKWVDNEKLDGRVEELKNKLDSLKTSERSRLNDIQRTEKHILKLQDQIANPPDMQSMEEVNEEIKALRREYADLPAKNSDLQDRQRACIDEEARHKAALEEARRSLQQLDDANHRKFHSLQEWDKTCADVVSWLRQNQNRFKMEVMEPPVLSVTVSDGRYGRTVENCFSNTQLKMFVMQCEEDYKLFNRLVCDTGEALGRPTGVSTWCRPDSEIAPPPMDREAMREIGFDGYALDFIKFPQGLKTYLTADVQLHRIAIGIEARKVNLTRAMDACSRSGAARYIVGTTMNNVSRSRYGKQLTQNSTYECRQASRLVAVSIDPSVQRKLQTDMEAAKHELRQVAVQIAKLTDEDKEIRTAQATFKFRTEELNKRKGVIAELQTRLERLPLQLQTAQDRLTKLQNAPSVEVERNRYKSMLVDLANQRIRTVTEHDALLRAAIAEQTEATKLSLQSLQIAANLGHLEVLSQERDDKIKEATERFNKAQREFEEAKQSAHDLHSILKDKLLGVKGEVKDRFRVTQESGEIDARGFHEWAEDLATEKEKLELTSSTSAGVLDQYEQRKQAIEQLRAVIADKEEKVNKKERAIKAARDNWEPALTRLVDSVGERFSAAFDRIGCAGEIRISQHDDYDKWAIDILVKFRDNEKLQLLTGERQSGGERSLTTIMYLMSLTEEARTPFSLVDEINQGMDARAERAVHNSLVEVTCKADSGQYFLITPKLLPDLNYHERMKVLCVNNGEWLPENVSRGDMMSMIDTYVRINRGGGHSVA